MESRKWTEVAIQVILRTSGRLQPGGQQYKSVLNAPKHPDFYNSARIVYIIGCIQDPFRTSRQKSVKVCYLTAAHKNRVALAANGAIRIPQCLIDR